MHETLFRFRTTRFFFQCRRATNPNVRGRSQSSGSGSALSSVIFNFFVKGNDSKLKQSVSRLVIKALHTAEKMNQELTD
jgi:hypothetical protein